MPDALVENPTTDQNVRGSVSTPDGFTVESNFQTADELKTSLGDESAASAAEAAAPKPRRNRRADPTAAVSAAVGKQRTAERLAEETSARLAALEAENAELKKPKPAPVAAPAPTPPPAQPPLAAAPAQPVSRQAYARYMALPDAPKIESYTGDNAFAEWQFDVAEFVADKRFADNMQRMQQHSFAAQTHATFTERLTAAKARIPDFDTRFNPNTPIDTRVFPFVQRLENGPDVMLYLSEHQDIAQRLTTLHPTLQVGEIGEIAGMLKAQNAAASSAASARPAISQAKPPTKRVVGAPTAATDEPPDEDASEDAHEAFWGPRRAELRRRHR